MSFLFDFADEMFLLILAMDFGSGKEMTYHFLYFKFFRQIGLIKQCKLSLACSPKSSLIRDYIVCDSNPTHSNGYPQNIGLQAKL